MAVSELDCELGESAAAVAVVQVDSRSASIV